MNTKPTLSTENRKLGIGGSTNGRKLSPSDLQSSLINLHLPAIRMTKTRFRKGWKKIESLLGRRLGYLLLRLVVLSTETILQVGASNPHDLDRYPYQHLILSPLDENIGGTKGSEVGPVEGVNGMCRIVTAFTVF